MQSLEPSVYPLIHQAGRQQLSDQDSAQSSIPPYTYLLASLAQSCLTSSTTTKLNHAPSDLPGWQAATSLKLLSGTAYT